jgi:hypothetical protein
MSIYRVTTVTLVEADSEDEALEIEGKAGGDALKDAELVEDGHEELDAVESLRAQIEALLRAGQAVVDCWTQGDLAEAVNTLADHLQEARRSLGEAGA